MTHFANSLIDCGLFGAADGVTGAVFRDTVRFTGELDAGTLTVKKFLMGTSTQQPSTSTSTST